MSDGDDDSQQLSYASSCFDKDEKDMILGDDFDSKTINNEKDKAGNEQNPVS